MSTADRDIIAVEVKSLRNELISLGNTRDVEGNFIFSRVLRCDLTTFFFYFVLNSSSSSALPLSTFICFSIVGV